MKRIYVQKIIQHNLTYYIGKADPRDIVRIATKIEVGTTQDAQRPLDGKRVKSIASYVDDESGLLPNTLVLATNNEKLQVHPISVKDETGSKIDLFYLDFPTLEQEFEDCENCIDVMDGQHRLYAFEDEFRTMKDATPYEIGFTLFITPTLREQRKIFMVCNEKQEKVSGNLLMWFKEKLKMLQGSERTFYPLVNELNSENASPLKGRIIMGGEKIKNGIKAQQLIRVLDKANIKGLSASSKILDDDQRFKLICTYLKAWEKVCGFSFQNPDHKTDGPAYKISGIRYMVYLLPTIWEKSIMQRQPFTEAFVEETLKQFISSNAIPYDEFFTCDENSVYFKSETATREFAETSIVVLKGLDSDEFNPLA